MPLEQLNLKFPPEVLADWRSRASAEGCSVRDWLLVITGSQARPKADLEGRVEALENALAALQARRSPAPADPPQAPALHTEAGVAPPAGAVTSRGLAELLKVDPSAPNKWASKYGPGEVWRGWGDCWGNRPSRPATARPRGLLPGAYPVGIFWVSTLQTGYLPTLQRVLVRCQPTSKTAPLPTPKSEPPPTRSVASSPDWFRLGCACGASVCSWFAWLIALVVVCH